MPFIKLILSFLISFLLIIMIMPKFIPYLHKLKFGQIEREEGPSSHKAKSGTPTMGGVAFILTTIIAVYIVDPMLYKDPAVTLMTLMFAGFGLVGLIDDYLIVVKKTNIGLKPSRKYLLQSVFAVAFCFLAHKIYPGFSTVVTIPLVHINIELGWFYYVLVYFMFTATSNGVNLSDGLDGLATGLSMIAIAPFIIFAAMLKSVSVASYGMALIGALLGFMYFNYHPARVFMGDVGSLSLGAFLAAIAILTKQELMLIIVGGVFVIETLSVILQVAYYKMTKKRLFRMAPLHHHFELLGWQEQQVVLGFWFAGFVFGILGIVLGVL